jgi:hypothetical protein
MHPVDVQYNRKTRQIYTTGFCAFAVWQNTTVKSSRNTTKNLSCTSTWQSLHGRLFDGNDSLPCGKKNMNDKKLPYAQLASTAQ